MLESVVNVSEGRDDSTLAALARACGPCFLDLHSDRHHHRSVFTLAGEDAEVEAGARGLARAAVELLDLRTHAGAHPRFGVVDVVPFVAVEGWPLVDAPDGPQGRQRAQRARDAFAAWAAKDLRLPVFLYGPERPLPQVRKAAWEVLDPDLGPGAPHLTAGAVAVGCRPLLMAYNLWLAGADLAQARAIASRIRSPEVRALGFAVGTQVQVSCNLVAPMVVGPAQVWDQVSRLGAVARAELVGLLPERALMSVPQDRWEELDLGPDRTIEHRLRGHGGGAQASDGPGL